MAPVWTLDGCGGTHTFVLTMRMFAVRSCQVEKVVDVGRTEVLDRAEIIHEVVGLDVRLRYDVVSGVDQSLSDFQ